MALTPSQRRRQREREAHRRAILDAAERLLSEKGFDAVTMEELAREAEFSVGALYMFFDNKEDLCGEVLLKIAKEFGCDFKTLLAQKTDPMDAIAAVVELRLRCMEKHAKFFRVIMGLMPGSRAFPDHAIPASCVKQYENYIWQVSTLWRRAIVSGRAKRIDPLYATLAMEGAINAFSAYWSRKNINLSIPEQMLILRRSFLDLMLPEPEHQTTRRKRCSK